jgi:hypothetical protein
MKFKILLSGAFMMLLCISMMAQTLTPQVISSSGGFYSGASATLSVTVAEMTMVETFSQPNNILTQGFQQPEQLTTAIQENELAMGDVSIYPNPTNGQFIIGYNATNSASCLVQIFDMTGQVVFSQSFDAAVGQNNIHIDISRYRQGIYLLGMSETNPGSIKNTSFHKINLVY